MTPGASTPCAATHLHRTARPWRSLLAAALAAVGLLGGCGPGTGGTGDGNSVPPLLVFGASVASVCSAGFSSLLDCPVTGSATSNQGSQPVLLSDADGGYTVSLRVDGHTAQFNGRCGPLQFTGTWAVAALDDARFYGTATVAGVSQPASLALQPVSGRTPGSVDVTAVLRALDGSPLAPAVQLQRHAGDNLPAPRCPA